MHLVVHPTDNTRLDLIIPGEAHFYVKAATPQERQQWLVALGSSKAGLHTQNGVPTLINGMLIQFKGCCIKRKAEHHSMYFVKKKI